MKQIYPTAQVAHLWAHKVQSHARNSNSSLFFHDSTIYSYGEHFPIARHITTKNGSCVLFTTKTYSVTTQKHLGCVGAACSHLKVFHVEKPRDDVNGSMVKNEIARVEKEVTAILAKAKNSRKWKGHYIGQATKLIANVNEFAEFFGFKSRAKMPTGDAIDKLIAQSKQEAKAARLQRAEAEKHKQAQLHKNIQAWRAGEECAYLQYLQHALLRVQGDEVVTSKGARFPLEHARKAIAFVRVVKARGEPWHTNGHTLHVGEFKIDSIDADGNVRAGCHSVQWIEIERFANTINA